MGHSKPTRLGIVHFLGWMLGCGLVLACYRLMWHELSPETRLLTQTLQALFAIVYGAALGGLVMLLSHRLRGNTTFPSQPGHYLLVFAGFGCLLDGGTYALFITLKDNAFGWYLRMAVAWGMAAAVGLAAGAHFAPLASLRSDRDSGAWCQFRHILAALALAASARHTTATNRKLAPGVGADRALSLHWSGVAVALALAALNTGQNAWFLGYF